ncbi:MAG: DUF1203 domain-containing protein [Sphingobium sp.]|nr:DUF1203 domain-containing protein [Sphingobium sp.]
MQGSTLMTYRVSGRVSGRISGLPMADFAPLFPLAAASEADDAIRALFERDDVAYIHAHNAAPGCFAARIDRN